MPRPGWTIALLATALLAGCGAGETQERTRPATPVASAQVAAAIEPCGVSTEVAADGAIVPPELRPGPAQVAAAGTTGYGFRARVVYARPLREVMNAIIAKTTAAGHEISFTEYESYDGEIFLRRGNSTTTVRLLAVRECPSISQAAITAAGS